jgi:hypothetical protein
MLCRSLILLLGSLWVVAPAAAQGIVIPNTFTNDTVADANEVNANFAALAADALNRTSGTMSGTLTTQDVVPQGTGSFDLGRSTARWNRVYLQDLQTSGGTFSVSLTTPLAIVGGGSTAGQIVAGAAQRTLYNGTDVGLTAAAGVGFRATSGATIPYATYSVVRPEHASGTMTNAVGGEFISEHAATAAVTSMASLETQSYIANSGGGTNSYGVLVTQGGRTTGGTGTITNAFGVFVNAFGTGYTNKWAFFSGDTSAKSYLAGGLLLSAGQGIYRPDGTGLSYLPGNGTSFFYGNQEFRNTGGSTVYWSFNEAGYFEGIEVSDPAAPSTNSGRLYFRDNGAGKTQLVVRFPTGAVQVLATEP